MTAPMAAAGGRHPDLRAGSRLEPVGVQGIAEDRKPAGADVVLSVGHEDDLHRRAPRHALLHGPEQFVSPRSVDHRTDLWACAVVTYACLLGQLPFVGETIGALSIAVHKGQFTPPSGVTSLRRDRRDKLAIYARAGIPSYWIVNIPDRVLEVHVEPRGDVYARKNTSAPGDEVALLVDGRGVGRIAIATLLP